MAFLSLLLGWFWTNISPAILSAAVSGIPEHEHFNVQVHEWKSLEPRVKCVVYEVNIQRVAPVQSFHLTLVIPHPILQSVFVAPSRMYDGNRVTGILRAGFPPDKNGNCTVSTRARADPNLRVYQDGPDSARIEDDDPENPVWIHGYLRVDPTTNDSTVNARLGGTYTYTFLGQTVEKKATLDIDPQPIWSPGVYPDPSPF